MGRGRAFELLDEGIVMRMDVGLDQRALRRTVGCLAVALSCLIGDAPLASGQDEPADKPAEVEAKVEQTTSFWMQKKLEYSQHILSGLALEDFEQIGRSAQAMQRLGKIEAFVRRHDTGAYRTQFRVFQFANEELIRFAADKNIDGAALAFTQLTLSCVNCHKQLRAGSK